MESKYDVGALELIKIEGIGPKYDKILKKQGIETTADLLRKADTNEKRFSLSKTTGIPSKLITKWVSCADLIRIKGIGEEYSDFLNTLNIHTVQELSNQSPNEVFKKSEKLDVSKSHIIRKKPTLTQLETWIKEAKKLPPLIEEPIWEMPQEEEKPIIINERKPFEFIDPYVSNSPRMIRTKRIYREKRYSILEDPLFLTTIVLTMITLLIGILWLVV